VTGDGLGVEDLGHHAPVVAVVVAEAAEGQDGRSQVGVVHPGRVVATVLGAGADQAGPDEQRPSPNLNNLRDILRLRVDRRAEG